MGQEVVVAAPGTIDSPQFFNKMIKPLVMRSNKLLTVAIV